MLRLKVYVLLDESIRICLFFLYNYIRSIKFQILQDRSYKKIKQMTINIKKTSK